MQMDIIDQAVYDLIHGYPKGAPALSAVLYSQYGYQVAPGTLMNKANPEQPHQLTVREGDLIQRIQGKYHLLHAQALTLNHICIPLGKFSSTSDLDLLTTYTRMHKELGEVAGAIHEALLHGQITIGMVQRIRQENYEAIQAMLEMEQRLDAIRDDRGISSCG
jgi:hypothetical protein